MLGNPDCENQTSGKLIDKVAGYDAQSEREEQVPITFQNEFANIQSSNLVEPWIESSKLERNEGQGSTVWKLPNNKTPELLFENY